MKKKTINLLANRDEFVKVEKTLRIMRLAVIIYCSLFVIAVLGFAFLQYRQNKNIQNSIDQKTILVKSLNNYKDQEAKLIFVAKKVRSYDKFILDDARFLPYYNLLNSALKNSSEASGGTSSATLSTFVLNKDRAVSFTLLFGNVADMVDSFKYIESKDFLSNFEQLSLNGLTVDADKTENALTFSGKFKKITDETSN